MVSALGAASLASASLSLLVILALLAGAAWLAKRLRETRGVLRRGNGPQISIIASRAIGPQASLMIVEAEGQRFLIGAGRGGVTAIGALNVLNAPNADFHAVLQRADQGFENPEAGA